MKAHSLDLRERVLALVDAGTPHAQVVRLLRVSLATIGRLVRLRREGGALAGKPHPSMRPLIGEPERAALEAQLAAAGTDASLAEHCELWHANQGVRVSGPTMGRALARVAGWTQKKESECKRAGPGATRGLADDGPNRTARCRLGLRGRERGQPRALPASTAGPHGASGPVARPRATGGATPPSSPPCPRRGWWLP